LVKPRSDRRSPSLRERGDQIARGVADALREKGLQIPDAVSLVGSDDWEILPTQRGRR
jgi:LacI family transcriptional regulator